jgi:hypothetical protein
MSDAVRDLHHEAREVSGLIAKLRELCGEDDQAFVDTLEGETEVVEAARRVLRWVHEQGAQNASCKALVALYSERAKLFEERAQRGRTGLLHFLLELGLPSMPLPEGTLIVSKGKPSLLGEPDPAKLPDELVRIKREPDRVAIKAKLEEGFRVEGCSLSNAMPTLSVRVK